MGEDATVRLGSESEDILPDLEDAMAELSAAPPPPPPEVKTKERSARTGTYGFSLPAVLTVDWVYRYRVKLHLLNTPPPPT
jgi:hypothetical protein